MFCLLQESGPQLGSVLTGYEQQKQEGSSDGKAELWRQAPLAAEQKDQVIISWHWVSYSVAACHTARLKSQNQYKKHYSCWFVWSARSHRFTDVDFSCMIPSDWTHRDDARVRLFWLSIFLTWAQDLLCVPYLSTGQPHSESSLRAKPCICFTCGNFLLIPHLDIKNVN